LDDERDRRHRDAFRKLSDLHSVAKMTYGQLAEYLGVAVTTVYGYREESYVPDPRADMVLELWDALIKPRTCIHNTYIECAKHEGCENCGWNPREENRRLTKWKEQRLQQWKLPKSTEETSLWCVIFHR